MNASKQCSDGRGVGYRDLWKDGKMHSLTPRQVTAAITGGFDAVTAQRVLADERMLDYVKHYLREYTERAGHIPYDYALRLISEHNHHTNDGDADLRVAHAVGFCPVCSE